MVEYFLRKNSTNYTVSSISYTEELDRAVNSCEVNVVKTDIDNISIGDEVSIGYVDGVFVTEFAGRVTDKAEDLSGRITFESFGGIINQTTAEEVYINKSPEFIAEDLITNYTDLTYASTATSGVTISRFLVNTALIGNAFNDLLKLMGDWIIRSDNDKNFYFEPKNTTISSETITINEDSILTSPWNKNPDKIVNKITLIGDVQTFATDIDGFTAVGGETEVALSYKPKGKVIITKNGTELIGGVEDSTATKDYTVDKDQNKVNFEVALTVSDVITINYEYEVSIRITAQNDDSVTKYGVRGDKVTDTNIRTMTDARTWVQNYLTANSTEDISGEFKCDISRNIKAGEILSVVDEFNKINSALLVTSVTLNYPEGTKLVKVGKLKFNNLNQQKELMDRLNKLEQQFDNSDILQLYREIAHNLDVQFAQTYITRTRFIDNSWICGSSTNAIVGTWTGTAGGGQLVVGDTDNTEEIIGVVNAKNLFVDHFDDGVFYDSTNSTATLNTGSSQVDFTAGQVMVSEAVFDNDQIVTKATLTANLTGSATLEMSNDDDTWNEVTNGTQFEFPEVDFSGATAYLLMETGDKLLLETGDGILLDGVAKDKVLKYRITEDAASTATLTKVAIKYEI